MNANTGRRTKKRRSQAQRRKTGRVRVSSEEASEASDDSHEKMREGDDEEGS